MATRHSTAPARAGERSRSPSALCNRANPPPTRADALLDPDLIVRGSVIRATRPDTAHVRAPRWLDVAGELLTATLIIAGGVFAYGFIPVA